MNDMQETIFWIPQWKAKPSTEITVLVFNDNTAEVKTGYWDGAEWHTYDNDADPDPDELKITCWAFMPIGKGCR